MYYENNKYKEALERARNYYSTTDSVADAELIEHIFPELKESEDEKIRKHLISLVKNWDKDGIISKYTSNPNDIKQILGWLEKQKEFVSTDFDGVWEWADCDELAAPLEKYSKDAIKEMCHAWYDKGIELERKNWLKKQNHVNQDTIETIKRKIIELFDTLVLDQCFSIGGLKNDILKILNDIV